MRTKNTFGVHFILREIRGKLGLSAIYMRIVVNSSRTEVSLKRNLNPDDWNDAKGFAKPKDENLRQLNSDLEQLRGMVTNHYHDLQLQKKTITAEILKNLFAGVKDSGHLQYLWDISTRSFALVQVNDSR